MYLQELHWKFVEEHIFRTNKATDFTKAFALVFLSKMKITFLTIEYFWVLRQYCIWHNCESFKNWNISSETWWKSLETDCSIVLVSTRIGYLLYLMHYKKQSLWFCTLLWSLHSCFFSVINTSRWILLSGPVLYIWYITNMLKHWCSKYVNVQHSSIRFSVDYVCHRNKMGNMESKLKCPGVLRQPIIDNTVDDSG